MQFRGYNYHKSGWLETFASNLSAIEFIAAFRKRHRKLFKIIIILIVASILVGILMLAVLPHIGQTRSRSVASGTVGAEIQAYEVISESEAIIYANAPSYPNPLKLTISYSQNGSFCFAYDYLFEDVPPGFQKLLLNTGGEINLYNYDLNIQVTS